MSRLTERDAETLPRTGDSGSVRVLELQARWSALVADQVNDTPSLQARQRGHSASKRDGGSTLRITMMPRFLNRRKTCPIAWRFGAGRCGRCSDARKAEYPAPILARVYRLADRIAARARR